MNIYIKIGLAILASWRLTHLISAEDGPFDIIFRIRKWLGQSFFGSLMDCFYCTSIWVSVPFALWITSSITEIIIYTLSISGASCLLYQISNYPKHENE